MADAVSRPGQRFGTRERRILLAVGALLLGFLAFQRFALRGLVFPIRVVEGSMAPSLLGDHFHVSCADCGESFDVDIVLPSDRTLTCSRCGHRFGIKDAPRCAGDRVVINRWNAITSRIRRWDLVAARDPLLPGRLIVKRVAALPHEVVSIAHGNVIIDGTPATKSLRQFRDVAITVADEYRGDSHTKSDWVASDDESPWHDDANGWSFDSSDTSTEECCWLVFQPARISSQQPTAVVDDYRYNQSVSRKLNAVSDLLMRCEFADCDCQEVCLRFDQPDRSWQLRLDFRGGDFRLESNGRPISTRRLPRPMPRIAELAICDGRILCGLDGTCRLIHQERELLASAATVASVGARNGSLQLNRLFLTRDIFYLPPSGYAGGADFSLRLSADQFFLLGDNSPISIDSRNARYGPIASGQILGTVTRRARRHD